jgi:hypothetical protein
MEQLLSTMKGQRPNTEKSYKGSYQSIFNVSNTIQQLKGDRISLGKDKPV